MGPMNDDDDMVTTDGGRKPVISDPAKETGPVGERRDDNDGVEERLAPAIEEAGYGYGV